MLDLISLFILLCLGVSLIGTGLSIFNMSMPIGGRPWRWQRTIWRWETRIFEKLHLDNGSIPEGWR